MQSGIRALPQSALLPDADYNGLTNLAILRYLGALPINPLRNPTTNIPVSALPLVETDLHVSCSFPPDAFIDEVNLFSV